MTAAPASPHVPSSRRLANNPITRFIVVVFIVSFLKYGIEFDRSERAVGNLCAYSTAN